jgi:hypothetical protein
MFHSAGGTNAAQVPDNFTFFIESPQQSQQNQGISDCQASVMSENQQVPEV